MEIKALDLFHAYTQGKLKKEGGYIVACMHQEALASIKYEITGIKMIKSVSLSDEGLTIQADGEKLYIIIEPASYPAKETEPFLRSNAEFVPHRFDEVSSLILSDRTRVLISKEPVLVFGSFYIAKPLDRSFAFIFYHSDSTLSAIESFLEKTLLDESRFSSADATSVVKRIIKGLVPIQKATETLRHKG
jgi:hypothetical protein